MTEIQRFGAEDSSASIVDSILEDGVAIVEKLWAPEVMDLLNSRVEADLAAQETGGGEFFGDSKRSTCALFARGREFSEHLLLSERVLEIADGILLPERTMAATSEDNPPALTSFQDSVEMSLQGRDPRLGPNCHHYRLNASVAMQVFGGGGGQMLHRDSWRYAPYMHIDSKGPQPTLAAMVAVTDFTLENGATQYVPGSNLWPEGRQPEKHEIVQAVMPKGSVALWLGSVLHGFGASTAAAPRTGFIFSFVVDRFTQEENQFLSVPPEIAKTLPEKAQQLLGYRSAGALNFVEGYHEDNLLVQGDSGPL